MTQRSVAIHSLKHGIGRRRLHAIPERLCGQFSTGHTEGEASAHWVSLLCTCLLTLRFWLQNTEQKKQTLRNVTIKQIKVCVRGCSVQHALVCSMILAHAGLAMCLACVSACSALMVECLRHDRRERHVVQQLKERCNLQPLKRSFGLPQGFGIKCAAAVLANMVQ